jgi:hypothetical protein
MKLKPLCWVVLLAGFVGLAWAEDDGRIIGKYDYTSSQDHHRTVSVYLNFKEDEEDKDRGISFASEEDETRYYAKIWEGLFLQVTTESEEKGVGGYLFSFSKDEANKNPLQAQEAGEDPTLRDVSASDFRTDDNSTPVSLHAGPATMDDPGPYRVIHYRGFDVEIRVLEFKIGDAELEKKPYFKSISYLVTVREKDTKKNSKNH